MVTAAETAQRARRGMPHAAEVEGQDVEAALRQPARERRVEALRHGHGGHDERDRPW
jgi:hypothetical protein